MILYILIALTLLTFVSWLLIKNKGLRLALGSISTAALVVAVVAVSMHLYDHWGMVQTTTSKEQTIYTAGDLNSPAGLLIVSEVGTDSDNYAMVFRDASDASEAATHFVPNQKDIVNAVKKSADYTTGAVDEATAKTETTTWTWKSDFFKGLFSLMDNDELVSEKTTVTVPEDTWVVLTSDQAKKLSQLQSTTTSEEQAATQQQLQATVQNSVAQYIAQNPNATADEIASYTTKATATAAANAIKEMIANN